MAMQVDVRATGAPVGIALERFQPVSSGWPGASDRTPDHAYVQHFRMKGGDAPARFELAHAV